MFFPFQCRKLTKHRQDVVSKGKGGKQKRSSRPSRRAPSPPRKNHLLHEIVQHTDTHFFVHTRSPVWEEGLARHTLDTTGL